jgi:uncharacterized protein
MNIANAGPMARADRIAEIDVVRGVALFGVLWMNLFAHALDITTFPESTLKALPTASIDMVVGFVGHWAVEGKAQALFSMLFGFGFAMLMERSEKRGAKAGSIYMRRLIILQLVGFANIFLFWTGDILHAYAAVGFLLLLLQVRRWPGWSLLALGIPLAIFGEAAFEIYGAWVTPQGEQPYWVLAWDAGAARRWIIFQGSSYAAYVVELSRAIWEIYGNPFGAAYLGWILGRFLIGSWIFRQGWLQNCAAYARGFRRWAMLLIPAGLFLACVAPVLNFMRIEFSPAIQALVSVNNRLAMLILALGYGAGVVTLCQNNAWRRRLSGFGAVGQMALTNYLMQGLVYFFVLYGFGLGWLPYAGATFCLVLAAVVFAAQIWFSRWWLARYRFGPMEWLWRSGAYGCWQSMRFYPDMGSTTPAAT